MGQSTKSKSLVLRKGKVEDETFNLAGKKIISKCIKEEKNPVKCQQVIDATVAGKINVEDKEDHLAERLKSGLPGRFKAWIYQDPV